MVLSRLWQRVQQQREQAAVSRRPIPDDLWKRTLVRYPFLQRRNPADTAELRRLTSLLLDRKEYSTVGDLVLTDAMAVAIAAQAALPVLRLGLQHYDGFVGIVVHADQVVARRQAADDDGVVHEFDEVLAGEAMEGGPLFLSWADVRAAGWSDEGYNVVIHEFAHVLDMSQGAANGIPPLPPGLSASEWMDGLQQTLAALRSDLEAARQTLIDPYAAEGEEEFFAVSSEVFFTAAAALQAAHPDWYALLCRVYLQDPALEGTPTRRR